MESDKLFIKENVVPRPPLSLGGLVAAVVLTAAALGLAALVDLALPEPLTRDSGPPHRFIAEIAHEHLVNLTSIGPRVAGSYENDVLGVGVVVEAVKQIARHASPHVRVELDVQTASGAFPLTFLDGMNHVYQDVSNVVARVSSAGTSRGPRPPRSALLLNCHIDTVPDSPGASDDGAGCAVLLETLRALAASRSPPRHDAIFLFNGAEENVLQASHGFIMHHKWAKSVRAFINIEACGAGGREVLFQAGPHDPWIVEVYAGAVPHPFASSLAQELFQSGLIPADTDFRIFRDFGKLSGVDLAWSANGYVYHTALDTAERVSLPVLQRTGDNVLALTHGMLASPRLSSQAERAARQPVYFDVVGLAVVSARAPAALAAALLALLLVALQLHLTAAKAKKELLVSRWWWWRAAAAGAGAVAGAALSGAGAALGAAALLHGLRARLTFYSRGWLLAPLYAFPALAGSWAAAPGLSRRALGAGGAWRGWWAARALQAGGALCGAGALAACACAGLRSGFLPWLWTALPAAANCLHLVSGSKSAPAWWWGAGAALPVLQTWYLALGSLRMFVPVTGRAGSPPVPPDMLIALTTAALVLGACSWLLPLVVATRSPHKLIAWMCVMSACAIVFVLQGDSSAPYSPETPQRLMVFHTRRTIHPPLGIGGGEQEGEVEHFYWVPELDVNTPHSVDMYVPELAAAQPVSGEECARWLYCGMPYFLPVLSLVRRSHRTPAPAPPAPGVNVRARLSTAPLNRTHADLHVDILQGPAHVVLIVSPAAGARVVWSSAIGSPLGGPGGPREGGRARGAYFFALHSARAPHAPMTITLQQDSPTDGASAASGTQVSLAGHAMFGTHKLSAPHARLLRALPQWVAPTGWGVDLHLYTL